MALLASELPVWTIRPNWRGGVLERLEWLTDVIEGSDGTEQRRGLRLSPRRSFEATFNPIGPARSYFDLWLHRLGDSEMMLPLWHDAAKITAEIAAGAAVIPFDNTYREFVVGGMAVLVGETPHQFDVVTILAMDDNGITVDGAEITRPWPKGSVIHPLRRARIDEESMFAALSSRVGQATMRFDINQANDIADEGAWTGLEYLGLPVVTISPDRKQALDLSYVRKLFTLDNEHGLRDQVSDTDRAFTVQMHDWLARGRQEHAELRALLYRLQGRLQPVWLPTFNDDLILARPVAAAASALDIREIGYAYTGGIETGREHILIGGKTPAKINALGAPLAAGEERLVLSAPVGADFLAGHSAAFLDVCRLDQDSVEINHLTTSDGACTAKAAFRSFLNTRTAPEPIYYPIPATPQGVTACGDPEEDNACVSLVEFEGWYFKARVELINEDTMPGTYWWAYDVKRQFDKVMITDTNVLKVWEFAFYDPVPVGNRHELRLQFPGGSTSELARARASVRRWNETGWTFVYPEAGSWSLADGDGFFDVRSLWPDEWFFTY